MAIYAGSRYIQTYAYTKNGDALVLGIRERQKFDLTEATYYTVVKGDTIDGIAYKQYNDANLWWAIMDCNPKYQTSLEIMPGDVLTIPPYEEVVKVCE